MRGIQFQTFKMHFAANYSDNKCGILRSLKLTATPSQAKKWENRFAPEY